MRLNKRKLFEDLHNSGCKPGDKDYRDKVEEVVKRFFIVNDAILQDNISCNISRFVIFTETNENLLEQDF